MKASYKLLTKTDIYPTSASSSALKVFENLGSYSRGSMNFKVFFAVCLSSVHLSIP